MNETAAVVDVRVPLMIGGIGHRDLVSTEVAMLGERVRDFLGSLQQKYPDLRVTVLTSLADGADRLVADAAKSLAMPVVYVLPMPSELYERDFDAASLDEYRELLRGGNVLTLPLLEDATRRRCHAPGARTRSAVRAARVFYRRALPHPARALGRQRRGTIRRDGRDHPLSPGRLHARPHRRRAAFAARRHRRRERPRVSRRLFARSARRRADRRRCEPGEVFWLSRNDALPRTPQMPARYEIVLRRMVEFSRDTMRFRRRRSSARRTRCLRTAPRVAIGAGERDIAAMFGVADWLALHYRGLTRTALRVLIVFAALASVCFLAYSNLPDQELMIYPYLGFMTVSIGAYALQRRGDWQRRYVDYRVLAEALRVQFYWAVAGCRSPGRKPLRPRRVSEAAPRTRLDPQHAARRRPQRRRVGPRRPPKPASRSRRAIGSATKTTASCTTTVGAGRNCCGRFASRRRSRGFSFGGGTLVGGRVGVRAMGVRR